MAMREACTRGQPDEADALAKDAAPYGHPRPAAVDDR